MATPDWAGAAQAIEDRLRAQWSDTPIAVQNGKDFPKADADGTLKPWVYLEIEGAGSTQRGVGAPGNQLWVDDGLIAVHVFVPVGKGAAKARQIASAVGEIYRAARFYDDVEGYFVRTFAPHVDGGGSGDDDGLWWRVSVSVPFEFWYRR